MPGIRGTPCRRRRPGPGPPARRPGDGSSHLRPHLRQLPRRIRARRRTGCRSVEPGPARLHPGRLQVPHDLGRQPALRRRPQPHGGRRASRLVDARLQGRPVGCGSPVRHRVHQGLLAALRRRAAPAGGRSRPPALDRRDFHRAQALRQARVCRVSWRRWHDLCGADGRLGAPRHGQQPDRALDLPRRFQPARHHGAAEDGHHGLAHADIRRVRHRQGTVGRRGLRRIDGQDASLEDDGRRAPGLLRGAGEAHRGKTRRARPVSRADPGLRPVSHARPRRRQPDARAGARRRYAVRHRAVRHHHVREPDVGQGHRPRQLLRQRDQEGHHAWNPA